MLLLLFLAAGAITLTVILCDMHDHAAVVVQVYPQPVGHKRYVSFFMRLFQQYGLWFVFDLFRWRSGQGALLKISLISKFHYYISCSTYNKCLFKFGIEKKTEEITYWRLARKDSHN